MDQLKVQPRRIDEHKLHYSGKSTPIEESELYSEHINLSAPSAFEVKLHMQEDQDEISLLHFG